MDSIWDGDRIHDRFRAALEDLADRADGEVEVDEPSAVFCRFEPHADRTAMRLGVYHASGRRTLRFDTVRAEIELAVVAEFAVDGTELVVASERGSREFRLDTGTSDYTVRKEQV